MRRALSAEAFFEQRSFSEVGSEDWRYAAFRIGLRAQSTGLRARGSGK
jgi:hypothetical protein